MSLSFEVDVANREVTVYAHERAFKGVTLSESDLIELLSRIQASDSTLAEQAGL